MSGRQGRRQRLKRSLAPIALALAIVSSLAGAGIASADELAGALATDDLHALDVAVSAIEHAPTSPELADDLFAAGRVCEDKLADPARALALYDRIVRQMPDARVATAASRRVAALHELIVPGGGAIEATTFAHLVADADHLSIDDVVRRADALAAASWPGAPIVGLWLADWLRRAGRYADAQARYAHVLATWPTSPQAALASRGAAACAIDAREWDRAAALVDHLPAIDPVDRAVHDDLVAAIARGRRREHLYTAAWLGVAVAFAAVVASFLEAIFRGGRRWPSLRPPLEIMFLAPIALVFILVAFTAHYAIAPAVMRISITGVGLAWLSGSTLDLLRARRRPLRARAVAHIAITLVGVIATAYIAMTHDGLLDLLAETVRFGPGS